MGRASKSSPLVYTKQTRDVEKPCGTDSGCKLDNMEEVFWLHFCTLGVNGSTTYSQ